MPCVLGYRNGGSPQNRVREQTAAVGSRMCAKAFPRSCHKQEPPHLAEEEPCGFLGVPHNRTFLRCRAVGMRISPRKKKVLSIRNRIHLGSYVGSYNN